MRNFIRNSAFMTAGAAAAVLGTGVCESGKPTETHEVTVEDQELKAYTYGIDTLVGTLATHSGVKLEVHASQQITPGARVPFTGIKLVDSRRFKWTDTYEGLFPGSVDFALRGLVEVTTQSENLTEANLPKQVLSTDVVNITIDKSKFFLNRPRIDTAPPQRFVVKDGKIVERIEVEKGKSVRRPAIPPMPIFAKDGTYTTGNYRSDEEGDSAPTDVYEGIFRLGRKNVGKNAGTNLHTIAQVEVGNPKCIARAFEVAPPQELVEKAFRSDLGSRGYNPQNVTFHYIPNTEWPTPADIRDERGNTYAQRRKLIAENLGKDVKIVKNSVDCKVGNVANPEKVSSTIRRNSKR